MDLGVVLRTIETNCASRLHVVRILNFTDRVGHRIDDLSAEMRAGLQALNAGMLAALPAER